MEMAGGDIVLIDVRHGLGAHVLLVLPELVRSRTKMIKEFTT